MDRIDALVIGAGVVGLAIAAELARRGRETVVVEAECAIGQGVSSRNSEVVDTWLGVHVTLDLAAQVRFGPDFEWLEIDDASHIDYAVQLARAEGFEEAIRRYWPGLPDGALAPAYSGVRPKIHGPGEIGPDFRIDGPARHGVRGLVNLFGIESPGLTSALAIAEEVAAVLDVAG